METLARKTLEEVLKNREVLVRQLEAINLVVRLLRDELDREQKNPID